MKHLLLSLTLLLGLAACKTRTDVEVVRTDTTATTTTGSTIAEYIASDPQFSTLQQALAATGLDQSLQGAGPFTLFAPTNAAFAKLGARVDTLMLPKNHDQLREILMHHVADGQMTAAQVGGMTSITTLQGSNVDVTANGGSVLLNGSANLTGADYDASNGTIHVIDTVLLPPTEGNTGV